MILDEIHLLGADRGPILEVFANIFLSVTSISLKLPLCPYGFAPS